MQNKSRSRTDVPWIISSVSLAATLGIWGLFVGNERKGAGVVGQVGFTQPNTQSVVVTQPQQMLAPGQVLLFGGTAPQPQQTQQQQVTITQSRTRHGGGGGGGGGGGATTSTGSSKP